MTAKPKHEGSVERHQRLAAEGRWQDFIARREDLKHLVDDPAERGRILREEFGPGTAPQAGKLPPPVVANRNTVPVSAEKQADDDAADALDELLADVDVKGLGGGEGADTLRDVRWVANVFHSKAVSAADSPSPFAWNLLHWARSNKTKFFTDAVSIMQKADVEKIERTGGDDGRKLHSLLDLLERKAPAFSSA